MKKNLLLLVALLLCRHLLPAQRIHEHLIGGAESTWINYSCTGSDNLPNSSCRDMEDQIKVEYPPWIIGGSWNYYFLVNGSDTWIASSQQDMVRSTAIDFHTHGTQPVKVTQKSGVNIWSRDYYCTYSAQSINHPTAGTVSMAFTERENHHQPSTGPTSPCTYMEGNAATTYLCLTWIPNTSATNWGQQLFTDLGPIIWPAAGYFLPNGQKSSLGCSNDATIQADDGYLYVFYKDQSCYDMGLQMGPGRLPGIRVARAPISDALNPHAYQTFYEDASGIHWNPSLPAGLTKDNIGSYLDDLGPQGSLIVGTGSEANRDYTRFAVARVSGTSSGTNYYLGVGSYQENGSIKVCLKYSYDLLHWFDDRVIYSTTSYNTHKFTYPIFLNASGFSNTSISEENFYIVGTTPNPNIGNTVHKMRLFIEPPPPICYDEWGNQISCQPTICYDEWGNQTFCPPSLARKATTDAAATLDNSKGRVPFVYPNPGPGTYRLSYTLKGNARTQLNVLDLMGRQIQTGSAVNRPAGNYTETVNISGHAKGVYMLELLVNGKKQLFKVIYQ